MGMFLLFPACFIKFLCANKKEVVAGVFLFRSLIFVAGRS